MGRQLVRLADGSGFSLFGERLGKGAALELQLDGDRWLPGTIDWSPNTANAVVFTIKLGGPHERHGTAGPELHLRIDPSEAWFRFPAGDAN